MPFPAPCPCSDQDRRRYGCGCSSGVPWTDSEDGPGYVGRSRVQYTHGARLLPWSRTCPQYAARHPVSIEVMQWLADYRRGALGDVRELEAPLLDLLRAADSELGVWEAEQMRTARGRS